MNTEPIITSIIVDGGHLGLLYSWEDGLHHYLFPDGTVCIEKPNEDKVEEIPNGHNIRIRQLQDQQELWELTTGWDVWNCISIRTWKGK